MVFKHLSENVILHSKAVAEVMYQLSGNNDEMYVLGLLHDIGKLHGAQGHAEKGAAIAEALGFKYHKEIYFHGIMQDEYSSQALDILNAADLSVNAEGNVVGYEKRTEDIARRYGVDSKEYTEAHNLSQKLRKILELIVVE